MKDASAALEAIRGQFSAEVLDRLEDGHVFELMKLAAEGRLRSQELAALAGVAPLLSKLITEFISTVPTLAAHTATAQARVMDNADRRLRHTVDSLREIAMTMQADASRIEIARIIEAVHDKAASHERKINKENNRSYRKMGALLLGAIGAMGTIAALLADRGGRSS